MLSTEAGGRLRMTVAVFRPLVWPVIASYCGGGRLVAVEQDLSAAPGRFSSLDVDAGIDYIQITPDGVPWGIAARTQEVTKYAFDTFTIRQATVRGGVTELAKRLAALRQIDRHPLFPRWTVQAYVSSEPRRLLSVGAVSTQALLDHVSEAHEGNELRGNHTTDATFLYVSWDALRRCCSAPFIWSATAAEACRYDAVYAEAFEAGYEQGYEDALEAVT